MKARSLVPILMIAAAPWYGCDDGGGGSPPSSRSSALPATCEDAFEATTAGSGAAALEVDPVGLSTCQADASGAILIGGDGGCGPNVVVDRDASIGKIQIRSGGKLVFPDLGDADRGTADLRSLSLETAGIRIEDGGLFGVGSAACPMGYHPGTGVTITFTGDRDMACDPRTGCDDGSVKGIEVRPGGILRMVGSKGVNNPGPEAGAPGVSWTTLREPTLSDEVIPGSTLHLTEDVTKGQRPWEDGDWIVVATSSFSPFESEFVQIDGTPTSDGANGSTLKTKQKLEFIHFGSKAPTPSQLCDVGTKLINVACGEISTCTAPCLSVPSPLNHDDPRAQNFGIDERAEVGLISRSIKLTAELPAAPLPDQQPLDPSPSLHWGGEIRIAGDDSGRLPQVAIVGVEIEKFGKDQLGSYPIHLHMIGDTKNTLKIHANSIHHSFNKCITLHMTSNVDIEDNVCARIVGHIFYQEYGAEENISFRNNLGLGAMSNSFDINPVRTIFGTPRDIPRSELIRDYWWIGDNMVSAADYNYDGFNIPNRDDQKNPTHGSCKTPDFTGGFGGVVQPPYSRDHPEACAAPEVYTEPASGFWITNPSAEMIGNAIGGCQGVGRGFWWVPPTIPIPVNGVTQDLKFKPLGIPGHPHAFLNNRAHACYAGFYGEPDHGIISEQLFAHKDGTSSGQPVITDLPGMTATRNRFRGVWLRPTWFVLDQGRFATNRESVSLVTSGGLDGNAPGVWLLLQNSVLAGVSSNNVDRFGDCPRQLDLGQFTGGKFGCIDHTPPPTGVAPHSGDELGEGYPTPEWNMFGYMLYDGPVRVFDTRFVNFLKDPSSLLTEEDNAFLATYASQNTPTAQRCVLGEKKGEHCNVDDDCCKMAGPCPGACPLPNVLCADGPAPNCCQMAAGCNVHFVYEGDAAFGWFQSNQSAYPTGTVSRRLSFVNTDLRHQIYTEKVSLNLFFNDGDKNTAIIDEDGTLTGFGVAVRDPAHTSDEPVHPISLNNLPFNATSNSVDECLSTGAQNQHFEGRDTSLISPGSMATLEFSTLYPWQDKTPAGMPIPFPGPDEDKTHTQFITFERDDPEVDANGVVRKDESGNPIHAEMVLHGRDGRGVWEPKLTGGYGYTASASPAPDFPQSTGRAGIAHVMTVGVLDAVKPDISETNPFFVRLGICYTDADGAHPQDPGAFRIRRGYKSFLGGLVEPTDPELLKYWSPSECRGLDSLHTANITTPTCPGPRPRLVPKLEGGGCPPGSVETTTSDMCAFPTNDLERVDTIDAMKNEDGTPNLQTFFYDRNTGMLFLWVAQDEPNALGPSPLGSCTGKTTDHPACPKFEDGESYYACPAKGCHTYLIQLDDPSYAPGPSKCEPYETYTHGPFAPQNELVLYGTDTVVEPVLGFDKAGDPFHIPSEATDPKCKITQMSSAP